jgi:hypothetical protein
MLKPHRRTTQIMGIACQKLPKVESHRHGTDELMLIRLAAIIE